MQDKLAGPRYRRLIAPSDLPTQGTSDNSTPTALTKNSQMLSSADRTRYAHDTTLNNDPALTSPSSGNPSGHHADIARRDSVRSSHHERFRPATVSTQHDVSGTVPSEPTLPRTTPKASTPSRDPTAQDPPCQAGLPFPSHQDSVFIPYDAPNSSLLILLLLSMAYAVFFSACYNNFPLC